MTLDTRALPEKYLRSDERLQIARKFMKMKQNGDITDAILGQRFTTLLESEDPVNENGAIALKDAGFWKLSDMLSKMSTGRVLNSMTVKSPTDVLSSLTNTVTTTAQSVLARIDIEPIIYK
jgi:hypothetical protein